MLVYDTSIDMTALLTLDSTTADCPTLRRRKLNPIAKYILINM